MTSPLSTDLRKRSRPAGRGRSIGLVPSLSWRGTVSLSIGGIRLTLEGLPPGVEKAVQARFQLFVVPASPAAEADLVVRVRPAVVNGYIDYRQQDGANLYSLETKLSGERVHVWSYAFAGWFETTGSAGQIALCDSDIEPPERSIENYLRVVIAWKAAARGGFLLHASGLVRDGRAYLFFGPSGSGKTTITRLSPTDLLLNDDCILIGREGAQFRASGVPFKGSESGGARMAGSFPIAGLFRLVQSRRVFSERLRTAQAVAEIAASVPFVSERPEGLETIFSVLEDLVTAVPVSRLHFRLASDFWTVVEEAPRG